MDTKKRNAILKKILSWYKENARDLPWRRTKDPYKIWISEIMLQQTQVSRVIDYYERFLERFPKLSDLAKSEWEDMLPYWRGLGFYSRGKNMLKGANMIQSEYGGEFPQDLNELQKIPGIGPYTAAAIVSFAFGHAVPALDTNLNRVFQRVFGCTEKGIIHRAEELFRVAEESASLLNHAFMDLGSEICKGRKVLCEECPLAKECHFFTSGQKEEWEKTLISGKIGKKVTSSKKILMEVAAGCIHRNGKYLIARRPKSKGGNWEFPGGKRERGEDWRHLMKREIQEELEVEVSVRPHFFEETWEEKEYFWRVRFFRCQILHGEPKLTEHTELKWVKAEDLHKYDFPSANAKAIERLKAMRV